MKRSTATSRRRFTLSKWAAITIVAIFFGVLASATAWMQSRDSQEPAAVAERAQAQLERALFVDEDQERAKSSEGPSRKGV